MARTLPPAKVETVFKSVQELTNSNQVQERFKQDMPEVDVSLLISPSAAREEELNYLQLGLKSCSRFQLNFEEEVFEEYIKNLKLLSESLLKDMATSLNVDENCFLDQCGERTTMIAIQLLPRLMLYLELNHMLMHQTLPSYCKTPYHDTDNASERSSIGILEQGFPIVTQFTHRDMDLTPVD
ncbi:hypothetical protein RND71_019311 [Anisodus tanguticus]|uniref:Uncharacterized protein n=1 Tax=Anisodus tanguticus TaxID=243964 RepID=A0AAE1RX76_9SOLA|nr:hypothetical protein RND71_019311 [Anisodus tanguticus]